MIKFNEWYRIAENFNRENIHIVVDMLNQDALGILSDYLTETWGIEVPFDKIYETTT